MGQSSVGQTHTGFHLHVLHLPTVVPNEQTNQIRLALLHSYYVTVTLHWKGFLAANTQPILQHAQTEQRCLKTIFFSKRREDMRLVSDTILLPLSTHILFITQRERMQNKGMEQEVFWLKIYSKNFDYLTKLWNEKCGKRQYDYLINPPIFSLGMDN